jgi:nitrogen fixation-related uncharacterized protein
MIDLLLLPIGLLLVIIGLVVWALHNKDYW